MDVWKAILAVGLVINVLIRKSACDIITEFEPSGTLYRAVGEQLELTCSYRGKTTDNSSDNLSIERCTDRMCFPLPRESINSSSIRVFIPKLRLDDSGTYECRSSHDPDIMSVNFLKVGYRPSPPKDIYCFSTDHLDMNCTVTLADRDSTSELGYNVTIDFQSDRSTEWLKCLHYNARCLSCYWKSPADSDSFGMDFLSDFSLLDGYRIRVRVMNILGTSQAIRTINDTSTIVRISKLHEFSVSNITSRKASLSWKLPEYLLPGAYIVAINYSSIWNSTSEQLMCSNRYRMRTELGGLVPYTSYQVTIRVRGRMVADDRNWSPMEKLSFRTDKDAPSAAPQSTVGGYFLARRLINNTEINCALQIYVKPLARRMWNGNMSDLYYQMSIQGDPDQRLLVRPITTISLSDKDCWNDGPYTVVIQACIEERSCSTKHTVINIPLFHPDTDFPYATEVIAECFGDVSVKVSWLMELRFRTRIEGVTIFWCRGNKGLRICESDLSWKKLAGDVTEAWLNLTHFNYHDWMFAVSFTTHSGESGGMVFEECQFRYFSFEHEETSQRNSDTPFESVKPTFNLLSRDGDIKSIDVLSLTFRYCDAQFLYRKPEQYEVFYKAITADTDEQCVDGAQSFNVTATLRVQEIILPDLDPMSRYAVCMRIRTSIGISELSDVKWRKPLTYPDTGGLAVIIKTLATLIFLVILVIAIWCVCHRYKAMDVNVQIPTIDKCTDFQSEMEVLMNDNDNGIELKGKVTQASNSEKRIVKTRRPLPAPPALPASTRESTDSGVMRSSIGSQAVDSCKGNISTTRTDREILELPTSQLCQIDKSNDKDNYSTLPTSYFSSSGSTPQVSIGIAAGLGDYCQWNVLACSSFDTGDSRLTSPITEIIDGKRIQDPTDVYGIGITEENSGIPVPIAECGIVTTEESNEIPVPIAECGIVTTGESSGIPVPIAECGIVTTGESSRIPVPIEEYGIGTTGESSGIPVPIEEYGIVTTEESSRIPVPIEEYGIVTTGESSRIPVPIEEYGIGTTGANSAVQCSQREDGHRSISPVRFQNQLDSCTFGLSATNRYNPFSRPCDFYIPQTDISLVSGANGTRTCVGRIPIENQLDFGMTRDNDFNKDTYDEEHHDVRNNCEH